MIAQGDEPGPMSEQRAGHRVASRLVRLCLQANGTLQRSPLLAAATRAALLADLAQAEALVDGGVGLLVDTSPTGFPPADRLLAAINALPDKSVEWWLRRGPDAVSDVVADLLHTGIWARQGSHWLRRYHDKDPAAVRADAAAMGSLLRGRKPDSSGTAVLAALVGVIGTDEHRGGQYPAETLLAACGPARWLITDLAGYLIAYRDLVAAAAREARFELNANFLT